MGDLCPRPVPLSWPSARYRPQDASYPGVRRASGQSVGAAKAAAPCEGSCLCWVPPGPGRKLEAGRASPPPPPPQESSGKVPPLPRPAPRAGEPRPSASCTRASSAHRVQPGTPVQRARGAAGRADAPTRSAPWSAAGCPWRDIGGHGGHLSLPPFPGAYTVA